MNNNLLLPLRSSRCHNAIYPHLAERGFAGMPLFGERHYRHVHKINRHSIFAGPAIMALDKHMPTKTKLMSIASRLEHSGGFYSDSFSLKSKQFPYMLLGNFVTEAQELGDHKLAGSAKRIAYGQLIFCVSELKSLNAEIKAAFKKINESELSPDKRTAEKEKLKEIYKGKADKVLHLIILLGEGAAHALPRLIERESARGKWVPSILKVALEGIAWREKMMANLEKEMAAEARADVHGLYAHGKRAERG